MRIAKFISGWKQAEWKSGGNLIVYRFPEELGRSEILIKVAHYIDSRPLGSLISGRGIVRAAFENGVGKKSSVDRALRKLSKYGYVKTSSTISGRNARRRNVIKRIGTSGSKGVIMSTKTGSKVGTISYDRTKTIITRESVTLDLIELTRDSRRGDTHAIISKHGDVVGFLRKRKNGDLYARVLNDVNVKNINIVIRTPTEIETERIEQETAQAHADASAALATNDRDGWDGAATRAEQLEERDYNSMHSAFTGNY